MLRSESNVPIYVALFEISCLSCLFLEKKSKDLHINRCDSFLHTFYNCTTVFKYILKQ